MGKPWLLSVRLIGRKRRSGRCDKTSCRIKRDTRTRPQRWPCGRNQCVMRGLP